MAIFSVKYQLSSCFRFLFGWIFLILLNGCLRNLQPGLDALRFEGMGNGEHKFLEHCQRCHPDGNAGSGPSINIIPATDFQAAFQNKHRQMGVSASFDNDEITRKDLDDITDYIKSISQQ